MSSIKKNFVYNVLLSVSQAAFPLITFSYVAHVIGADGMGTVSFVESVCRYVILFAGLGIPIYGIREVARNKDDVNKLSRLLSEIILIHLITTLFTILVYVLLVIWIDKFNQNSSFYILGIMMIISNVGIIEWYFQGIGDFKFITFRTLAIRTILTISVFFFVKNREDTLYFFALSVFMSVLNSVVNLWYAKKSISLDFRIKWRDIEKHCKPLFLIFATSLSVSIYVLLDNIMLGFLSDEKAVAFYSLSLRISKIPLLFVGSLGAILIPKLAYNYDRNNLKEFKLLISKSINFVITFSFPIVFFLFSLSNEIIVVFAGKEFEESTILLQIMSPLVFFIGMSNVFGMQILTPIGKDKYLTISVLFGTFTSITLNLILIPFLNAKGAAISITTTEFIVSIITAYFALRFIQFKIDYKLVLTTFLLCIPICFFSTFLRYLFEDSFWLLIIVSFVTTVYYAIVQLYFIKNAIIVGLYNKILKKHAKI